MHRTLFPPFPPSRLVLAALLLGSGVTGSEPGTEGEASTARQPGATDREPSATPPRHAPAGYTLVWADEFDGTALDNEKWVHWLPGKRRDATNTADAVTVSDGLLTITTYTEDDAHSTGMISTRRKFEPTFGYFEARIDFNDAPGMWSAFWMESPAMGRFIGNPQQGGAEIDIVEHRQVDRNGNNIDGQGVANLHWDGYGPDHKGKGSGFFGSDLGSGFHTYALEWTPGFMEFLVDGKLVWTVAEPVFHSPEFITLSSEVDASGWAGKPPEAGYGSREASTTKMVVDHVRVYQKKPGD